MTLYRIRNALGLFASAIKSGEKWSPSCEEALKLAYEEVVEIETPQTKEVEKEPGTQMPRGLCKEIAAMKIDDIITELNQLQNAPFPKIESLLPLVIELAQHVKAQEPEPIDEHDIMSMADDGYVNMEHLLLVEEGRGHS